MADKPREKRKQAHSRRATEVDRLWAKISPLIQRRYEEAMERRDEREDD